MTTAQSNKRSMLHTLKAFFETESNKFTGDTPLMARISELNTQLADLESHAQAQATDTTANTGIKTIMQFDMIRLTVIYAQRAADYFSDKKDPLEKQLSISKSKLMKMTGTDVKTFCSKINTLLNENIASLSPNHLKATQLADLSAAINQFDASAYDTFLSKDTTQNATKFIKNDFKSLTKTVENINRLMTVYQLTDEELYNKYKLARKITNLGTRGNAPTPPTP